MAFSVALVLLPGGLGATEAETCAAPPGLRAAAELPPGLLDGLIGWIAINTSYDVSRTYRTPPRIWLCSAGEEIPYEDADLLVDEALGGIFDLSRREIHLVRPWSADDPFDVSVLLHELIHDVQLENRDWDCVGAPEFEAYWLQDKWLSERGVRPGFDWETIRRIARCPEGD